MPDSRTYIVTIEETDDGGYYAVATPAGEPATNFRISPATIETRGLVRDGATATDNDAWQAVADALAAVMPEPGEDI